MRKNPYVSYFATYKNDPKYLENISVQYKLQKLKDDCGIINYLLRIAL